MGGASESTQAVGILMFVGLALARLKRLKWDVHVSQLHRATRLRVKKQVGSAT